MKNISFYTAMEANFYPLGVIWVRSLLDIMDDKINKIFIYDVGLIEKQRQYLLDLSDKVHIFDSGEVIRAKVVHDENWRKVVYKKTEGLVKICKEENYPIVMMDSDMMIIEDISNEIYEDCDFQPCERIKKFINRDGYQLTHIGCWFVVHNNKGKEFVQAWCQKAPKMQGGHTETPALCNLLKENDDLNYKHNTDSIVAAPEYTVDAKVLHFKSEGPHQLHHPYERINMYSDTPSLVSLKLADYIKTTP